MQPHRECSDYRNGHHHQPYPLTLIEADNHLPPSITPHLTAVNYFWQLPNSCYHQSLSSIMTSHQSSTLGPPYYHSCYHQRLQSIITPPTAHLSTAIMQQLLWWVMLLSAQSHRHCLRLPMSVFFCWTQQFADSIFDSCTILLELHTKNSNPQTLTHLLTMHIHTI